MVNGPDWLHVPGADEETDEELRLRCRNQFSAVGQYHHDAAYTADIASFAGIRTDYIVFQHEAPRGPGSANAFIMIDSGPAPQEFVDTINAHVRDAGNHGHGDDMLCFPMPALPVHLTATVHPVPNLQDDKKTALLQAVDGRIRAAFRENSDYSMTRTWPHSRFSLSVLA
ncbi:baseplate J/gp47 family protein, partial [Oleidesulfovibrio sp.]|uniref:baseplate J/gp47 family protein n=1 Tax=Oleidesulfovibrio sp. TaxID=2909707 RepID=UPI003A898847